MPEVKPSDIQTFASIKVVGVGGAGGNAGGVGAATCQNADRCVRISRFGYLMPRGEGFVVNGR